MARTRKQTDAVKDAHARKVANQAKRDVAALKRVIAALCALTEAQLSVMPTGQRAKAEALLTAAKELD